MIKKERKIVIGTRKSKLALAQTQMVAKTIEKAYPDVECVLEPVQTMGDKILDRSLVSFGGKGIFIEEFERSIQDGINDCAVHSAKDMPAELADGLEIAAVLPREDPRDVLVWNAGVNLEEKSHLLIGTGSLRRQMQIKRLYPCECKLLRGNVNTRLQKLIDGEYDAIILAAAGLKRLGLMKDERLSYRPLAIEEMVPAGGQGIIAIEAATEGKMAALLHTISDKQTFYQLQIERYLLSRLQAGCHEAIGVYSELEQEQLRIYVMDGRSGTVQYATDSIALTGDCKLQQGLAFVERILMRMDQERAGE